jgi:phospholipase/carboxylesterase
VVRVALCLFFSLCAPVLAQGVRGKVTEDELPPLKKRDDPLVFAVYVPTAYDGKKEVPLILALHGGRGTARQFAGFLRPLAEGQGAILACPQGFEEIVGAEGYWWKGNKAEMAALDRLVAHVRQRYKIDAKRISLVGLADGAEQGFRWALSGKDRGIYGLVALNFLFKFKGSLRPPKQLRVCLIASRDAKEKRASLKEHAEKTQKALVRAKAPVVLRVVPSSSRSFFHGWEKEFRKAYQWFNGQLDWPKELAAAQAPPKNG